jgi:Uma2 family endonuclease
MTAEELLRLPDDGHRRELVRGRLVELSPAGSRSSIVSGRIHSRIGPFVERRKVGLCGGSEWGFLLATDPDIVRAPDVAVVVAARIGAEGVPAGYWRGAPDLAVEVVSPSDRLADVLEKVEECLTYGTRLVWVIDPEARKAIVFRPG